MAEVNWLLPLVRKSGVSLFPTAKPEPPRSRQKRQWSAPHGFLLLMGLGPLFGQGMTLVGSGYTNPASIRVSPGQIIKVFVSATKTVLPPQSRLQRATTVPLPKTLAGFSVSIRQGDNTFAAPLLAVEQTPVCTDANASSSDCFRTALTVQVPFEITVIQLGQMAPQLPGDLIVNDNGMESKRFSIALLWITFTS
jgi:hypothetical protein